MHLQVDAGGFDLLGNHTDLRGHAHAIGVAGDDAAHALP